MNHDLSKQTNHRRLSLGALALTIAATLYAAIASGCGPDTIIIYDCVDARPDAGDAGYGGATALPVCE